MQNRLKSLKQEKLETKESFLQAFTLFFAIDGVINDNNEQKFLTLIDDLGLQEIAEDLLKNIKNNNQQSYKNTFTTIKDKNLDELFIEILFDTFVDKALTQEQKKFFSTLKKEFNIDKRGRDVSDTKFVDEIYIYTNEIENTVIRFLNGDATTQLESAFVEVQALLRERWVEMQDKLMYDAKIQACWYGIGLSTTAYRDFTTNSSYSDVISHISQQKYAKRYKLDLPTKKELTTSLTKIGNAPFGLSYARPDVNRYYIFKKNNSEKVFGYDCDSDTLKERYDGKAVPLLRLKEDNNLFNLSQREVFIKWLSLSLIPKKLQNNKTYEDALAFVELYKKTPCNTNIAINNSSEIFKELLHEDAVRADIKPYNVKMLEDTNLGLWSLWNKDTKNYVKIKLDNKVVARDPKSSIVDGIVAIDFGTKSTVVVYQKENNPILPMRVGIGDLSKKIERNHYENPTVIEFNNINNFMESYNRRDGRPYTKWSDVTISHTAFNSMIDSKSSDFNSFVYELKQWAGDKRRKLKIVDKKGELVDLPTFLNLQEDDINPLELYAYYLGLYINNQHNGIYLNYILSFPVTYEMEVRNRILESFKRGFTKSLPQELLEQKELMKKLSVIAGASEPAAYAVVALMESGFEPEEDENIFYGVFDFGGGTTDFDFGIFREANGVKERRYDYVIEHFGAGGDKYLGGENLLELLAFEVFKKNRDNLLAENIQFILPPECSEFLGGETLINNSREANINTKTLMEHLRAFWEEDETKKEEYEKGILEVNLFDVNAIQKTNFELDIDVQELKSILHERIKKGVVNFFHSCKLAYDNSDIDLKRIDKINIFLAGNSSKSSMVKEIFQKEMESDDLHYKIIEPIGSSGDMQKPNGKTGVAFGLIETRKGGNVLVIDKNIKEEHIGFKYFLGDSKKKKFRTIVDKSVEFAKWIAFIDAREDTFELFYSSSAIVKSNNVAISDSSINKKILKISQINEDALVYIRVVSASNFEYVVAFENEILQEKYLSEVIRVEI